MDGHTYRQLFLSTNDGRSLAKDEWSFSGWEGQGACPSIDAVFRFASIAAFAFASAFAFAAIAARTLVSATAPFASATTDITL
jgi:hypothetical protein